MSKKHTPKGGGKKAATDESAATKTATAKSAKSAESTNDAVKGAATPEQAEQIHNGSGKKAAADESLTPEAAVTKSAEHSESSADAASETLSPQEQAELKAAEQFDHSFLKALAEMENLRRRNEKNVSDTYKFVLSDFALAIGEVRDCLETAINDGGEVEKLREGVSLTLRKLVNAMETRHILPIRPDIGAVFDPTIHMAIGMAPPTAQAPEKTVAVVVQAGYMLNGRVIRPADVMVSRQADKKTDKGGAEQEKPSE